MRARPRKALDQINNYVAAKTIESVKREHGLDKIIKLAANENSLGYSLRVKDAVKQSLESLSCYPDMNCTVLREKLAEIHNIDKEELIFGNGSFELISIVAQTFLEENDEAITVDPSFGWYKNVTWQMGGKVVSLPLKNFKADLTAVMESITEKTKIVWLCNPNNPTGTIVQKSELDRFLLNLRKNIVLVLDEAYIDFVQEEDFPDSVSLIGNYKNIIILRTFSKVYGLASFRIGYGIASKEIIGFLNKTRLPINVNTLAQVAAIASLEDPDFKKRVLENNKKSIELYYDAFDKLGLSYVKTNCNFILFNTGLDSEWVAGEYLKRGIIIRAGGEFGLSTWVRITIGKYEENELVIQILKELLEENNGSAI